eukprot:EG_transcript_14602
MQDQSHHDILNNPIYGELLKQQSHAIQDTRIHIERLLGELEERRNACMARRIMLNTFKKDINDSFIECRAQVKKSIQAMIDHLKQQQDGMLRELDETLQYNMDVIAQSSTVVDRSLLRLEQQIDEGQALLREQDTFLFFSKGNLYKQLPIAQVPSFRCDFRDNFPDLTTLSIQPFQVPLQHAVQVDIQEFLRSPAESQICGNIFHNGFRFQVQLKHDNQYLSAYLCLRAWHDVSSFLRVTVNFTLSLHDGPELLHSASAKNTFSGRHDGWGWNKFIPLAKLQGCGDVLFLVHFNELTYNFAQDDVKNTSADMDTSGDLQAPVARMGNLSVH